VIPIFKGREFSTSRRGDKAVTIEDHGSKLARRTRDRTEDISAGSKARVELVSTVFVILTLASSSGSLVHRDCLSRLYLSYRDENKRGNWHESMCGGGGTRARNIGPGMLGGWRRCELGWILALRRLLSCAFSECTNHWLSRPRAITILPRAYVSAHSRDRR